MWFALRDVVIVKKKRRRTHTITRGDRLTLNHEGQQEGIRCTTPAADDTFNVTISGSNMPGSCELTTS